MFPGADGNNAGTRGHPGKLWSWRWSHAGHRTRGILGLIVSGSFCAKWGQFAGKLPTPKEGRGGL